MNKTQEVHDSTHPSFVVEFLQSIMKSEVSNKIEPQDETLLIYLSDQTVAKITAPKVAKDTLPPAQTHAKIQNIATIRYVKEHDYGYGEDTRTELNRLELHNMEECLMYVEDAITTQLNAFFTNNLIEFFNGEKFMLAIEQKK